MLRIFLALVCLAMLACVSAPGSLSPRLTLWSPPAPPPQRDLLRIEPARSAASLGSAVELRVVGARAGDASCRWPGGSADGPRLEIPGRDQAGVLDVVCTASGAQAWAQVTYTSARRLPVADPYTGGVVLLKTRRTPQGFAGGLGRQRLDLPSLDSLLQQLGAWAFPAFPFDRSGTRDRSGLARWIVVDIPSSVNFYQAVELLREDRLVHPESYLPADGGFLRVRGTGSWPTPVQEARPREAPVEPALVNQAPVQQDGSVRWELDAIGAPSAWERATGASVGIAVVDTGVDVNHAAISPNMRANGDAYPGIDADGNGIPGDGLGVNFAHLAINRTVGAPRLGFGLVGDVSDWDGALSEPQRPWGHGTAIAALAAGSGERLGVAPEAWILAVDVQENLRASQGDLLEEDPRMRSLGADHSGPLRSSTWARAAGLAYAVAEGAGVVTCAWAEEEPHWILHDALVYAEDNCAVAVCSVPAAAPAESFPAAWRAGWLRGHGDAAGDAFDAWKGSRIPDFYMRPLRAALLVAARGSRTATEGPARPDLWVPGSGPRRAPVQSAVSDPRNDTESLPDRRLDAAPSDAVAAGLVAGAAALIRDLRPDLEPWAVRESLMAGGPNLSVPAALAAADQRPLGGCRSIEERRMRGREEARPWWKRVNVNVSMKQPGMPQPPAGPEGAEEDERETSSPRGPDWNPR